MKREIRQGWDDGRARVFCNKPKDFLPVISNARPVLSLIKM
jgi:hypothetical protein